MKYTKHFYTYFACGDAITLLWLPENERNKQTTFTLTLAVEMPSLSRGSDK